MELEGLETSVRSSDKIFQSFRGQVLQTAPAVNLRLLRNALYVYSYICHTRSQNAPGLLLEGQL